jgi:hypothetical protein
MTDTGRLGNELFAQTRIGGPAIASDEPDGALLALESQFNALAAELAAAKGAQGERAICCHQRPKWIEQANVDVGSNYEAKTTELEEILVRLDPIERAIMAAKASTIVGLGVKARHAAYVTSQYWSEPSYKLDWDVRAIRLFIEAVCEAAPRPTP